MRQVVISGSPNNLNNAATEYNNFASNKNNTWDATESLRSQLIAADGVISRLLVQLTGTPGVGNDYTFTIMKNGVATSLATTIADTDTENGDYVNEISVSAGDLLSIRCVPTSTPTVRDARWAVVFQSTNDRYAAMISTGTNNVIGGIGSRLVNYISRGATWSVTASAGNFDRQSLFPQSGTLRDFYVSLTTAPGAGEDYDFRAGNAFPMNVNIADTATTGSDTVNTASVSAGNQNHKTDYQGSVSPAGSRVRYGLVFESDIEDEYPIPAGSDNSLNNSVTEYNILEGADTNWDATLTNRESLTQCCRIKNLYISLANRPGTGASYQFTIMKNGVATALDVTVAHPNATGSNTTEVVEFDDFDTVSIRCIPSSSPNAVDALWGVTMEATVPHNLPTTGMGV